MRHVVTQRRKGHFLCHRSHLLSGSGLESVVLFGCTAINTVEKKARTAKFKKQKYRKEKCKYDYE